MANDLIRVEPAFEPEAHGQPYELHVEAIYDEYVDVLPVSDPVVETPLDTADEEALELGIASVFGSIREEEPTYALLSELNRLWAQPLAA
jgi:hypothetical protein